MLMTGCRLFWRALLSGINGALRLPPAIKGALNKARQRYHGACRPLTCNSQWQGHSATVAEVPDGYRTLAQSPIHADEAVVRNPVSGYNADAKPHRGSPHSRHPAATHEWTRPDTCETTFQLINIEACRVSVKLLCRQVGNFGIRTAIHMIQRDYACGTVQETATPRATLLVP